MNINYYDKPKESLETLLEKYNPKMYLVIEDVLSDPKGFELVFQQLIDIMKWGFEIKQIRHKLIHYKFKMSDKEILCMPANNFISSLILWYPFMEMDKVEMLDETYIFDFSQHNIISAIVKYLDDRVLPYSEGDFHANNKIVDEVFHNIRAIANAFGLLMGMSISMYDIWQAEKNNPEISEIIFGTIDPTLQPIEIERELERRTERLIELFSETDCDLKPLLVSGKNISKGQFKEMFVRIGMKSDIHGNTIPFLLDTNLVVGGLKKPSYQYIEAGSARKSMIMTKQKMGYPMASLCKILRIIENPEMGTNKLSA